MPACDESDVDGAVLQRLDVVAAIPRVSTMLDANVGHQLRVALHECLAERPEVAGLETRSTA